MRALVVSVVSVVVALGSGLFATGCSVDAGAAGDETASAEHDLVGRATLVLGAATTPTSANVVLGPQHRGLAPNGPVTCGTAPSSTVQLPTAWVEVKNPSSLAAVVTLSTGEHAGGPSMHTEMLVYASPTEPTTASELGACSRSGSRSTTYWARYDHAHGDPLIVSPNSSLFVLVSDGRRNQGVFNITAWVEALVPLTPAALVIPAAEGQLASTQVLLSSLQKGLVPTSPVTCGSVPSSAAQRPRAYVEVKNPTNKTAVVSLATGPVTGGPSMSTGLFVYSMATAPATASELGACVTADQGSTSYWAGLRHAAGRPLILEPSQSVWVLIEDDKHGEGLLELSADTHLLD